MDTGPVEILPVPSPCPDPLAAALLDLNNAHEAELSWLDAASLQRLLGQAYFAARVGQVQAFLLSLDQDADHAGVNFRWFRERYDRFVYVDRIVVASEARGRGLAGQLYRALIDRCRRDGHTRLVCEVNRLPPNPGSDAFHAAFGFETVGEACIHAGTKTVRYLFLSLQERGVAGQD